MAKIPLTNQELNKVFFRASTGIEGIFQYYQMSWKKLDDIEKQKLLDAWFKEKLISITQRDMLK